eukprot:749856-Hanusia_phi.AAC.1
MTPRRCLRPPGGPGPRWAPAESSWYGKLSGLRSLPGSRLKLRLHSRQGGRGGYTVTPRPAGYSEQP